ncbi:carbon-nitrogen hydrolase family protein [Algicella marina]|nr:carbon-nitrogen hydrolase family protein [Algicella marina]
MKDTLRIAMAQMCSSTSHAENIATVAGFAEEARSAGAEVLALPEVAGLMNRDAKTAREVITLPEDDPFIEGCQKIAADHRLWIHNGSTPVLAGDGRFLNQSALIDPTGRLLGRYSKIHLFDADIPGGKPIRESSRFAPGDAAVLAETPWGPWGLSICYDLRFPQLYRDYAQAGATLLFVPSAFTVPTGRAHWEVLLRARAIETGAYVVAAAQGGKHEDGRETWGHSMIVNPWGEVLADMGHNGPSLKIVDLPIGKVAEARRNIPSLANGRPYNMARVR